MDWIKRLIRQFTEEDGSVPMENSSNAKPPQQTRIHREVEARVSYQYPQGNFRFPLIPDDERRASEAAAQRREPHKAEPRQARPARQKHKRQEQPASNKKQPETLRKPKSQKAANKPAGLSAERDARSSGSKRPFQRTDVPSPIYGFGKAPDGMYRSHFIDINEPYTSPLDDVKKLKEMAQETMFSDGEGEVARPPSIPSFLNAISPFKDQTVRKEDTYSKMGVSDAEDEELPENQVPLTVPEEEADTEESYIHEDEQGEGLEVGLTLDQSTLESKVDDVSDDNADAREKESTAQESHEVNESADVVSDHDVDGEEDMYGTEGYEAVEAAIPPVKDSSMKMEQVESDEESIPEVTLNDSVQEDPPILEQRKAGSEPEQQDDAAEAVNTGIHASRDVSASEQAPADVIQPQPVKIEEEPSSLNKKEAPLKNSPDKPAPQREQAADKKMNRPTAARGNETVHVPYNVVMLKRDKDKTMKSQRGGTYQHPSLQLLDVPPRSSENDGEWLKNQRELLDATLVNFNVRAHVVGVTKGPAVTRFEVQPEPGVKVNKITNLTDDIKLSLAAADIRIEAPIPGKNTIGIEVPNLKSAPVFLREILRSPAFMQSTSPLTVALGLDIAGQPVVTDLNKMPHGLIAGATGSGKSVCINSMLVSLLFKAAPHELKLLLIDPKMVELAPYNHLPHLVSPVITDVKAATAALKWAVEEMERRYELFAHTGVRDITRYNKKAREFGQKEQVLPYLVIVIDELADLMMVSPQDVEDAVCRIAQKARACGIHLVLATQRPSVDVITGLIKANIPTRAAFAVSSQVDSRTIIDGSGAEKLLGKGDMLFLENGSSKPVRIQGNFVSDDEIDRVADFVRKQQKPSYMFEPEDLVQRSHPDQEEDELFEEACLFAAGQGGASSSALQRRFRIGFNRAARLIDLMEAQGIISEQKGSKPRDILVSKEKIEEMFTAESPLS